jgi:menaquinone-dependent protoporphyrinogen IX oxidase
LKGIVAYDSYFGNTKIVAETLVEQIKAEGHEAEIRSVKEDYPSPLQGDFMFVGSPIRFGGVTGKTKRYVKHLDLAAWKDKPMAVFATVASPPKGEATEKQKQSYEKWALRAAPKLRDMAKDRGLNAVDAVLSVGVKDQRGPLVDDGLEKTKQFAHDFLQTLKK